MVGMGDPGKQARKICYACNRTATTKEHVPPQCFFPANYRRNLVTVPSCPEHNNAHSKDVEYVRGILLSLAQLGPNSKPVFDAMMRSIDRRPNLVGTMFQGLRPIHVDGYQTGAFSVDLPRFDRVITAIARAIHYRDFNQKRRYWEVFCPHFFLPESVATKHDAFDPLRHIVATQKYVYAPAESPEVFCYGRAGKSPGRSVYQFVFYEAMIVFAWPSAHITARRLKLLR
jgi:hypothetical protein